VAGKGVHVINDLIQYISSADGTAVEIAAALGVFILRLDGYSLETDASHPGLVSLSPLQVQAEVRDLAHRRLKSGIWQEVVARLGYSKRRWQGYLGLLRLGDGALGLAHEHRLSEGSLRGVIRLGDPAQQMAAVQVLVAGRPEQQPGGHRARGPQEEPVSDIVASQKRYHDDISPEMTDLDRLSGLLTPLHGFLAGLAAEAQWALGQRLVEPDTTQSFLLLRDTSGQLHRLLTAIYSQGESVCLDDMDAGEQDTSTG